MTLIPASFPEPDAEAAAASARLAARIRDEIAAAGGWLPFDRFMQRLLHEPGLGYYSGGSEIFGPAGDFITAPQLGDFLARSIATTFADSLRQAAAPRIFELGAGTGRLARQLLQALGSGGPEVRYSILETSADLRARQSAELRAFGDRVEWLERMPDKPFDGLILANEVADALPVIRFEMRGGAARPLGVGCEDGRFVWRLGDADEALADSVAELESRLGAPLPDGYRSEICPAVGAWIEALAAALDSGVILLIDYGMTRREYYHPQRSDGSLICHYRHRAHDDPFLYPGLQDVSASVDFSACADAARRCGLEVAGYTTQAQFLLQSLERMGPEAVASATPQALGALKTLVLPGEMGERFKLLALTKNRSGPPLPGKDFRSRL